jgi:hypothetical protein
VSISNIVFIIEDCSLWEMESAYGMVKGSYESYTMCLTDV